VSDKKRLLSGLHRLELGTANVDFRSTLSDLATAILGKPTIESNAFADANLRKYWNWLLQEVDNHTRRGLVPYFSALGPNTFAFACACQALVNSHDPDKQTMGRRALSRPRLLQRIDSLTDRQYESLACVAATAVGARHTLLTPAGN
jgi:hypothetical protein